MGGREAPRDKDDRCLSRAVWSPVLLSGDGHTSSGDIRQSDECRSGDIRREAPRDKASGMYDFSLILLSRTGIYA